MAVGTAPAGLVGLALALREFSIDHSEDLRCRSLAMTWSSHD
jgi:hypothetical protein